MILKKSLGRQVWLGFDRSMQSGKVWVARDMIAAIEAGSYMSESWMVLYTPGQKIQVANSQQEVEGALSDD